MGKPGAGTVRMGKHGGWRGGGHRIGRHRRSMGSDVRWATVKLGKEVFFFSHVGPTLEFTRILYIEHFATNQISVRGPHIRTSLGSIH